MKERRRRNNDIVSWSRFFWCAVSVLFSCVLISTFSFSTFRLQFAEKFRPEPVSGRTRQAMEAVSGENPAIPPVTIREAVGLPDQILVFLKYPPTARLLTREDIDCIYFSPNSTNPERKEPPIHVDGEGFDDQIVRCPPSPRGFSVSLALNPGRYMKPAPVISWEFLVYEAMIDRDNTTVVFVKGLSLRPERIYNASRFECVFGWDFRRRKLLLRSDVMSVAQEIVRCKTPLSVLSTPRSVNSSIKVSIRVKGRGTFHSIARPNHGSLPELEVKPTGRKPHQMCVCTMLRNQARFVREWVIYHSQIGVQRWFIYDNNSDDDIENVIESLDEANFNISRHVWPWIKTQEAGLSHCALRARSVCEWVGFIDVDEFFYLPTRLTLQEVIRNQSNSRDLAEHPGEIAEIRVPCHSFGPSGLKHVPVEGVMVGYTCRMAVPERHKSIVNPEALNSSLINVVHHFHLRDGFTFINADRGMLLVNHYKYQVWEVFKEKFYRRVATYVADWQDDQNVGSKDRAPGLGTRAVEPPDWSSRFCEVRDRGLRKQVLENLRNPETNLLPWQEQDMDEGRNRKRHSRSSV